MLGRTCVVGGTKTGVVVDAVDAGRSVLAVVVLAVVHVGFAGGALEACETRATAKTQGAHVRLVALRNEGRNPPKTPRLDPPSSPVLSAVLHGQLAGPSVGARVTHAGVQRRLAVLALGHREAAAALNPPSTFRDVAISGGRVTDAGF